MKMPRFLRAASAAFVLCAAVAGGQDEGPSLDDAVALTRGAMQDVAESDRAVDAARTGLARSVARAKVFFEHALRLVAENPDPEKAGAKEEAAAKQAALGMGEMLRGIAETTRHLAWASSALERAEKTAGAADEALAALMRQSAESVRKTRETLEVQRKQVQRRWEHANNPALGRQPEARNEARALVEMQMSTAAGQWYALMVEEARLRFIRDRRSRLGHAARLVAQRRNGLDGMAQALAGFRASMLNPLARQPAQTPPDRLVWPAPLRPDLTVLDESFAPPKPYQSPAGWSLRDRVRRFTRGGAP